MFSLPTLFLLFTTACQKSDPSEPADEPSEDSAGLTEDSVDAETGDSQAGQDSEGTPPTHCEDGAPILALMLKPRPATMTRRSVTSPLDP